MKRDRMRLLRNIGIAAHIDAGKTTLTERILFFTGKSHRIGETHDGDSQMDTSKQEIAKGITISSAATHTEWKYENAVHHLNIIDTPGHVDFMIEVERSLRVLDGMVALFDAVAGVEPQSETIWQQANRYKVPVIAMVNKMDRIGADFQAVVEQMRDQLGANAMPIQLPIWKEEEFLGLIDLIEWKAVYWDKDGTIQPETTIPASLMDMALSARETLLEALALTDEDFMVSFFEDTQNLSTNQIKSVLRKAVLARQMVPVIMGAAYKNKGVQPLMDAVCAYLPSPLDRGIVFGTELDGEESIQREPTIESPVSALAFKIALDDQNRQLVFFRVYSGSLKIGDSLLNPRTGKKEKIGRLYQIHSNKKQEIKSVMAGDIAATTGLKSIRTGDTLCDLNHPIVLESLFVPPPVINMAVEAKQADQLDKLGIALGKLQLEDPSFKVVSDQETGQMVMQGMGELHLEIIIDKLREDFGFEVDIGSPKVAYQERFTKSIHHRYRLKKQKGGSGLFAEIEVNVGPVDENFFNSKAFQKDGQRLQFVDRIVGGAIPKEFIPSVQSGFEKMLDNGTLGGYPIESLKVELLDGKIHSKDSNPLAFELCAMETFREISMEMMPQILEPLVEVTVTTPEQYLGNILGGLNRRRGMISAQEPQHQQIQIEAEVPLSEMFGYINHLRTVSSGRANFSMKFKRYKVLPTQMVETVLQN